MNISKYGLDLLCKLEDVRLFPYDDQTGKETSSWTEGATIGVGHLISKEEWNQFKNGISIKQANELLKDDILPVEICVTNNVTEIINQDQFDALCIFAFNIGLGAFRRSSALKLINDKNADTLYSTLELAWKAWNKSRGRVMQGLINRRNAEWNLYCGVKA